jgi:NADP-dependent 3-hydroxy acid dehydrogenase YdfG
MTKTIFITGATCGIGKACAVKFAQNNCNLIITGRRQERLTELANELTSAYSVKVLTLAFDIREKDAVVKAISTLTGEWKKIDILVNNAGLAVGLLPINEGLFDDWERMIDTNIKGLLYVSRCIIPLMIANDKGHIINIGSIAGKETYPNGNVYCATKHAVDSLTKAMRMDLLKYGIKVSQIAPGAVETEFSLVRFKGDAAKAGNVYKGYTPLKPEDVADAVYYVSSLPGHVNINDLNIMPLAQANATIINKLS